MGSKISKKQFADKLDASPVYSAPAAHQSEPLGARPISEARRGAALERQQLLKIALPLFESRLSQAEVAPLLGISPASLSRLLNLCPVKGSAGRKALFKCRRLVKLPLVKIAPKAASGGRESDFAALVKVASIVRHLEQRYAVARAAGQSHTACIRAALQDLGYFRGTPPLAARRLRQGDEPQPLVNLFNQTFGPAKIKRSRRKDHWRN